MRELKNTIFKISASGHQDLIRPEHLPVKILPPEKNRRRRGAGEPSLAEIESSHIQKILRQSGFNYTLAAEILGISRSSLYRKMAGLHSKKK